MNHVEMPDSLPEGLENRSDLGAQQTRAAASPEEVEEGKIPAVLGYIPFLFFVPLFGDRKNDFAIRHGRQAFALFVVEIVALLFLMDVVSEFFWTAVLIGCLGLALVAGAHAAQGKFWEIPYVRQLLRKYEIFGDHQESQ